MHRHFDSVITELPNWAYFPRFTIKNLRNYMNIRFYEADEVSSLIFVDRRERQL